MLDYFRKRAQSKFVIILFGMIALTFIFGFGVLPSLTDTGSAPGGVAVTVGRTQVRVGEVQRVADRMRDAYRQRSNSPLDSDTIDMLAGQALEALVDRELLNLAVEREGIHVPDEEVVAAIQRAPYFQRDGRFSRELYLQRLAREGIRPADYEADTRLELGVERLRDLVWAGIDVTDAEVRERYRLERERVELSTLTFSPSAFADDVEPPSEAELVAYHDAHPDEFQAPATVSGRVVAFDPEAFEESVEVIEDDVFDRYDEDLDRWDVEEEVTASHILIRVPQGADEAAQAIALARVEEIQLRLDEGADFAEEARANSEDPASGLQGGSLGSFPRGQMVPAFEDAAFGAEPGEIVGPVRTQFGYHLILVEDITEERTIEFEEAEPELIAELKREGSVVAAEEAAQDLLAALAGGASFDDAAAAAGLTPEAVGPATASEPLSGSRQLTSFAFALAVGERTEPVRTGRGFEVLEVTEKVEARPLSFEEARAAVEGAVRDARAAALAREAADAALSRVREDGAALASLADPPRATLESTGPFAPSSRMVPRLGSDETVRAAAAALSEEAPAPTEVLEVRGDLVLLEFGERTGTEPSDPTELESVRDRLLAERRQQAYEELLTRLRASTDVEYNPTAMEFLLGRG